MTQNIYPLWKSTLLAAIISIVANIILVTIAKLFITTPSYFPELLAFSIALFTFVGTLGAAIVFAIIRKFSKNPNHVFKVVAYIVLVLSLIPDAMLYDKTAGIGMGPVITLMLTHVVAAVIIIKVLTQHTRPAK